MSVWYSINGDFFVRDCPEVRDLVAAHPDYLDCSTASYDVLEVGVSFNDECNIGRPHEVDEILEQFGPHVIDPVFLHWDHDRDRGKLYIGPEDRRREAESHETLNEILSLLTYLTDADKVKLRGYLT